MNIHEQINYVEIPAKNIAASKTFFTKVFGFAFEDYGAEYTAFTGAGIKGGFYKADVSASTNNGSVLLVFYSNNLLETKAKIEDAGGSIIKPLFAFPGGRRFHFSDPNENEYAVWSDID
ncbi:MAG: VOC family protein [Magnetococcales bacterium]|nr:VOC family protein [Magnetococcales bacterium]